LEQPGRRRTYRTYTKRACLLNIGEVTMILSKKRRTDGPKQTKVTARQVVCETARQGTERGSGVRAASGNQESQSVERSVAISLMAYLSLVNFRVQDIPEKGP
jgi:hypothetical protein